MRGRSERGAALVLAVLALTVIGALVAAAFFAAFQEHRLAAAIRGWSRAGAAAEDALVELLRQWRHNVPQIAPYPPDSAVFALAGRDGRSSVVLYRLGPDRYLAVAEHRSGRGQSRALVGVALRRVTGCDAPVVAGLEMRYDNCQPGNGFTETGWAIPVRSRAWTRLPEEP